MIQLPEEWNELEEKKIAVRDWSAFSEWDQENRLQYKWLEVNGQKPAELLALINSLELRIMPYDDEEDYTSIKFDWVITGFSSSFIDI